MNSQGTVLISHPSADLYGSDRVMLSSVEALVGAGRRVVVTLPAAGPLVREIEQRGATVALCPSPVLRKSAIRPVGMVKLLIETARSLPKSIGVVRRSGADVVYVNTLTIPLWILVGRLTGRPVLCHVHEAEASASLILRRLLTLPLLFANRLVVNSEFSMNVIAGAFRRLATRSVVIYNAVPGPANLQQSRSRLDGPTRLLYVGRLSPRKGPDVAIEAVNDLKKRGIAAELDVVGAEFPGYEWFTEGLRERVRQEGLADRVHFHGFQQNVWPFLARTDIALVPSTVDEPFGNTAVESVLAARPLIVSATSGLVEAVHGYTSVCPVEPSRPELIADAVEQIANDWPHYRAAAVQDCATAGIRHDAGRYAAQVVAVVDSLNAVRTPTAAGDGPVSASHRPTSGEAAVRTDSPGLDVVVAMATYHRPEELLRTVRDVLAQIDLAPAGLVSPQIGVLVVDNDPKGSARDVIDSIADDRVRYLIEASPGIAAARNRALAESSDRDVLIFIDDDEHPEYGWLASLLGTFEAHRAAAVVGPVVSVFETKLDPWIAEGGYFERRRLRTGTAVEAAATNNLLLDLRVIRSLGLHFDERFGLSGGSDTLFTRSLTAAGESIIWCDEAIVVDHVPAGRATKEWVTRRAMRYGNSWSRTSIAMSDGARARVLQRARMVGLGAARLGVGATRWGVGAVTGSARHRARGVRTSMKGIGYIRGACGSTYVEYARPSESPRSVVVAPAPNGGTAPIS